MSVETTTIGFEEVLWKSADKLRSNMDAAEYKHVVLGLIFLKYVSDAFSEKYEQLKADGYGDEMHFQMLHLSASQVLQSI